MYAGAPLRLRGGLLGLPVSFLRDQEGFVGIFHGLPRVFPPSLVISFSVARGGRSVRVCGKFVEFSGSLVRVTRHWSPPSSLVSVPRYNSRAL
jgi:hypothetical protein